MSHPKRLMLTEDLLLDELAVLGWTIFDSAVPDGLITHMHPKAYEICYIVQGQITWWVNDEVYLIKRGDYFVTRPGEKHGGVNGVMERCEIYWLQLSCRDDAGKQNHNMAELITALDQIKHRAFPSKSNVQKLFERLITEHQHPGEFASLLSRALLHDILITMVRSYHHSESATHGNRMRYSPEIHQALLWIDAHLTDKFVMGDIAKAINMSTNYFQHRFLDETGQTPAAYCNRKRIEKAKTLLATGEISISHIALSLGFSSSQYFATVFKKYTGRTPRTYRKQSRAL